MVDYRGIFQGVSVRHTGGSGGGVGGRGAARRCVPATNATNSDSGRPRLTSKPPRMAQRGRVGIEVARRASRRLRREKHTAGSGEIGEKAVVGLALTWPAAAPLAFALGLFTALPERISYTVGRELMCLKSFSLRARLGGSTTVSSEAGGPNGLELPRHATQQSGEKLICGKPEAGVSRTSPSRRTLRRNRTPPPSAKHRSEQPPARASPSSARSNGMLSVLESAGVHGKI